MQRVVITGIGALTPLANNFHDSWGLVKKGVSGLDTIRSFDAADLRWGIAGEVKDFSAGNYLSAKELLRLDPFIHYAVAAAAMACEDAGLTDSSGCKDYLTSGGVIIGSSRGGITTIERESRKLCGQGPKQRTARLSPYLMPSSTISMAASQVALRLGIRGNCLGISNACASGTNAVGEGARLIRHGYSNIIIAGGADAPVCRLCVEGYGSAGALSKGKTSSASRPFDSRRDGFVIAEGACILVLEEYGSALKRNARIYGEIMGYSNTTDAFHITKPDGEGEARAIGLALEDAGVNPEDVDYVNAHGTSTIMGDIVEAGAIKKVFKGNVAVSSIKSMTGHMLAASGTFEAACTVMSINEGIIPPTINLEEKDPRCDINAGADKKEQPVLIAVSNSFGFGGVNAVLVLKKTA